MSTYERRNGVGRLPDWRANELPEGEPEAARMRGPMVRPSDFVKPKAAPAYEPAQSIPEQPVRRPAAAAPTARPVYQEPAKPVYQEPARPLGEIRADHPDPPPPSIQEAVAPVHRPPEAPIVIFDLRTATRAIWEKRFIVLGLAIAGAIVGAGIIPLVPKKFTASTSLYFDPRQAGLPESSQAGVAPDLILTMIDSQTQILSSGKVLGRVVDTLKLDQDRRFNGGATGEAARYVAVATLQKSVSIAREPSTYVVVLKVTTSDPEEAALIANQVVASFTEEESTAASSQYHSTNNVLDDRLTDLQQQLLAAEKAVETYRADNDMVTVQGTLTSDTRLTALNQLLVTAQQKTFDAKARADAASQLRFEDVVSTSRPDAVNSTSNSLTNLRAQYAAQAASIGSLESQLGARHPRLLAARSSLDSLASEIKSELQRLATSAQSDYEQARKAEEDVSKEVAVQKALQVNTSGKVAGLNELERKATAARDLYQALIKRSGQSSEDHSLSQNNIRVISEAVPPLVTDGPSRKVMFVAGGIAGFVFGFGLGAVFAILLGLFRHPFVRGYFSKPS